VPAEQPPVPRDGLPVTALYTAGVWAWSRRPGAELYTSPATARVFGVVEVVLRVARWFVRNAPSLRHGLVQRHVMLDALVADARADGLSHGVELAAGLSPRGAARTAEPGWSWTEVDSSPPARPCSASPPICARTGRTCPRPTAPRWSSPRAC